MFVAKVTGSLVSTQKADSLVGHKLLIVEPYRLEADQRRSLVSTGRTLVAVDGLGAGEGDYVLLTQGSSARLTPETREAPIYTVVVVSSTRCISTSKVFTRVKRSRGEQVVLESPLKFPTAWLFGPSRIGHYH